MEDRQEDVSFNGTREKFGLVRNEGGRYSKLRRYLKVRLHGRVVQYFLIVLRNGEKYGARRVVKIEESTCAKHAGRIQYS